MTVRKVREEGEEGQIVREEEKCKYYFYKSEDYWHPKNHQEIKASI